jgi:integrase/recombinase XerD
VSLVLSLDAWPEADRRLWQDLTRDGGPLDDRGALAHLRETTLDMMIKSYGRWLGWIAAEEPAALAAAPADRATMDRLRHWLTNLGHTRPVTRHLFVSTVLRVLMKAEPAHDWSAQRRFTSALKRAAGAGDRSRKQGRILSSTVLFDRAVRHATHDAEAATTELQSFKRPRDGTMVALLALVPMRRRSFVHLEIGRSILVRQDSILIALQDELTKNGLPWSCEVPEALLPLLQHYIDKVRPWLLHRGGAQHGILWVGDRGAPYEEDYLGKRIADITERLTGVRVSPHLFRDAAATTLARMSTDATRLIRPVLAHTSGGTAERHYIHASSIEAGRNYADVIARLKRKRP